MMLLLLLMMMMLLLPGLRSVKRGWPCPLLALTLYSLCTYPARSRQPPWPRLIPRLRRSTTEPTQNGNASSRRDPTAVWRVSHSMPWSASRQPTVRRATDTPPTACDGIYYSTMLSPCQRWISGLSRAFGSHGRSCETAQYGDRPQAHSVPYLPASVD